MAGKVRSLHLRSLIGFVGVAILLACESRQLGVPRHEAEAVSPDGRMLAFVKNHAGIDPPNQSLWLRYQSDGTERMLRRLMPDADWSDEVTWKSDSSRVAFLVNGVAADVFSRTGELVDRRALVERTGAYPEPLIVRHLAFADRGLVYQVCERIDDSKKRRAVDLWDSTVSNCRPGSLEAGVGAR